MKRAQEVVLMLVVVLAFSGTAWAQFGTAFTYQGRLSDNGAHAQGEFDFQFKTYNDPNIALGSQIGITVFQEDLLVSNGLFTVNLDFGLKPFTSDARWLEIGVRPGNSNDPYTILNPLQAITPNPLAILAHKAQTLIAPDGKPEVAVYVDNDGKVGIGTITPTNPFQVESEFESPIYGRVTSSVSSTAVGVLGETNGSGSGVLGEGFGDSAKGVSGIARGQFGVGVKGIAFSFTGNTKALSADNWSTTGYGVHAEMIASVGQTYGMYSWNHSDEGTGVYGWADSPTGTTYGVRGKADSPDGYSGYFEGTGRFVDDLGIGSRDPVNGTKLRVTQNDDTAAIHASNESGSYAFTLPVDRLGVSASASSDLDEEKYGVMAFAGGTTGSKYGLFAYALGGGPNYGVYSRTDGALDSFAGFFTGHNPSVMIEDMTASAAYLRKKKKNDPGDHYIA
ncbi:MAG: hypothetical protein GY869_29450, partial [Planctomycetes bacterium]|nr:hypothetical protein [Planctomycetota bacterium]